MSFELADYVEVPERIAIFRDKYPTGSLQSEIVELPESFAGQFIAVRASAFRTPDDERPGIGLAWEPVPGKTSFTLASELMNAETSAWGRAIVAVLAADTKRGIASAHEVRTRQGNSPNGASEGPAVAAGPSTASDFRFRAGKHKGKSLSEVPGPYLDWVLDNFKEDDDYSVEALIAIREFRGLEAPMPIPSSDEDIPF